MNSFKTFYEKRSYSENKASAGLEVDRRAEELRKNFAEVEGKTMSYDEALEHVIAEDPRLASIYIKDQDLPAETEKKKVYSDQQIYDAGCELDRRAQLVMLKENRDYQEAFKIVSLEDDKLFQIYMSK